MTNNPLCATCKSEMIKRNDGEYYCVKRHWYNAWKHSRSYFGYIGYPMPKISFLKYVLRKFC